jgi:hypothetical protein
MENKKFVCTDNRPEGMEEDFTGSQGSRRTVAVENLRTRRTRTRTRRKTVDIIEL